MFEIHDLHKHFGSLHVLKGITCSIAKGQVVVIIGPSGSGKSTFLRCLNLLEKPTGGTIYVDGVNITDPKTDIRKVRENVGMVFQRFNLFPHMTALENVAFAPLRVLHLSKEEARERALDLLVKVGLGDKADSYPDQLSDNNAGGHRPGVYAPEGVLLMSQHRPSTGNDRGLEVMKALAGMTMVWSPMRWAAGKLAT